MKRIVYLHTLVVISNLFAAEHGASLSYNQEKGIFVYQTHSGTKYDAVPYQNNTEGKMRRWCMDKGQTYYHDRGQWHTAANSQAK